MLRTAVAALAVALPIAAQADTYECLSLDEANAWHHEREHEIVAGKKSPLGNIYLWETPEGGFFIVRVAGQQACVLTVTTIDPRVPEGDPV